MLRRAWADQPLAQTREPLGSCWPLEMQPSMNLNVQMENVSLSAPAEPEGAAADVFAFPATPQQQQLWFLDQLVPGNPAYNIPLAYELSGDLDADALDQSLAWVVNRHESFRTVFAIRGEEFVQLVRSKLSIAFQRIDLRSVPGADRESACRRAVADAAAFRFDLATGPLVRGELLLLEPGKHVVIFNFHHIILDHLSVLQFAREFCRAYECFKNEQVPAMEAPSLQYPDFAVWQEQQMQEPRFQSELQDWVRSFDSSNSTSVFPSDHSRPMAQTFTGREVKFSFPPELSAGLRNLAKASKKSVYVTLLTLYKFLLARYSGQEDVVVGSPFSNRMVSDLEGVVGCCMNTLPLRSQLSGSETFCEALDIVQQTVLAAYSRQRVPLKLIVDALRPDRDAAMNPLFQSTFTLQDPPMNIDLEALVVRPLCIHNGTSKFDMAVWMWDSDGRISGLWEYNASLYESESIDRLIRNFQTLAAEVVAAPLTPWRRLTVVAPDELKLIKEDFNRTKRIWPEKVSLVELVEASATGNPEAVALAFGEEELSYRELINRALALSRRLTGLGVGSGSLVGVCIERSPDMVIAMLAILKSGGAYLPLDLAFPKDRLAYMIQDSALAVIVSSSEVVGKLPTHQARTVLVDQPSASEPLRDGAGVHTSPDSLAYVRYTSGSTGRPKGVAIPHRALLNFILSMRERPGCSRGDALLAVTTLSFDISELEIWLPLVCGGRIVLASRNQAADGAELLRLVRRHGITLMQATPATWRLLIEAGWNQKNRLKALCGGEALPPDLAKELLPRCSELWNMFGPTETTVWSTCARIITSDEIHIGQPIGNTETYIVDPCLQPVPIGVTGELLIGGDGLARGYLHRPELTAEKFIPHPFKPGAHLYRTGDLAVYRPDGNVVCRGRLDFQVKVRGYRIEPGEIEAVLGEVAGVKQAAVVVREEQLVAYYVSDSGQIIEPSTCREALRSRLPDYMVPAIYVRLGEIPLTPNGKVDRKALPAPDPGASLATTRGTTPRTGTEQKLVTIWEEVLKLNPLGVDDNFFEIGGHSLLAVKLFAKIEREFGRRLPLASLFQNPTIAQLAGLLVANGEQAAHWDSLVSIRKGGNGPAVFFVHGAGGNILIYRDLARHLTDGIPIYGLQSRGLDGHNPALVTVEEMANYYVDEITRRQPVGPYILAGYCMGGKVAMEMARLLKTKGHSVPLLAMLDSFNLNVSNATEFRSSKFSMYRERISFHFANLFALGPQEAFGYLKEKARMAREAAVGWVTSRRKSFYRSPQDEAPSGESRVEEFVLAVNDRAGFAYVPPSYDGATTLFKPKRTYSAFKDPKMGWSDVVKGPMEVVELDMNPHAMLVEPFVQKLAAAINERLRRLPTS